MNLRDWARRIKRDAVTLWFACRDPATPWLPKALCWFTVAYALSPIDLIPDFIPVLGYLDDVLLLPDVIARSRERAEDWMARTGSRPTSQVGMALVIGIWVLVAVGLAWWLWPR